MKNKFEANNTAQRRWGLCGCAWREPGPLGSASLVVGVHTHLGTAILGRGTNWEEAFANVDRDDEQVRYMAAPLPEEDPKYRLAVARVKAAIDDAIEMLPDHIPPSDATIVAGLILAERARMP